jgi:ribosomal protein S18 acetylase RimI-like enzyme
MNFVVREAQKNGDMDFFFKLGFDTMMITKRRREAYNKLIKDNPDASDDKLFELYRKEAEDYFDFSDPSARVFIVERDDGKYCGYLWMGIRSSEDIWDLEKPQWIYDIVVDPKFRGNGLGKMLLQQAEEFARESNVNIGLFVDADNDSAIALYNKMGYNVKAVPVSKKLEMANHEILHSNDFLVREEQETEIDAVQKIEFERFKRKVLFSMNVDEKKIKKHYEDHVSKYAKNHEKHKRLVALTKNGELAGSVWAGISGFSENVAMIYELSVCSDYRNSTVSDMLINSIENWAKNEGFSTMYILLHSEDDLDVEFFKTKGYIVPGFLMEKRLKS